ncbi:uncharacterized protein LOC142168823 [Nicotiana tabacum]|uniref:Uncharacterized protein LOC142168823 n=1 Tax=Nicotiana tabacum TaxID=4097 RepID=A0AC58SM78_TOBAC
MGTNGQTTYVVLSSTPTPSTPVATGSITNSLVDSAHPYYLHTSDYPGMNLVSSAFDGRAYGGWRRAIVIALSAKNKLGFIDGTLALPDADYGLQRAWSRCNDMVLSWLLNSVSKEIAESVLYSQSANDLWNDLED